MLKRTLKLIYSPAAKLEAPKGCRTYCLRSGTVRELGGGGVMQGRTRWRQPGGVRVGKVSLWRSEAAFRARKVKEI
jgi:hypothetical protein